MFKLVVLIVLASSCTSTPLRLRELRRHITSQLLSTLPEVHMNVSEIITHNGYPVENHWVTTDDGYILSIQHIPHGRNGKVNSNYLPVLLQHGLVDSSATWVYNSPEESLAFVLADAGYDVWLSNSRGNSYSNKHVKYTTKDPQFWDFSFEDMAKHDLPVCIEYVLNATKAPQLNYVGHSEGTMIGFIEFGRNHELGKKVQTFFALAPVAVLKNVKGLFKYLDYLAPELKYLFRLFGVHEFKLEDWMLDLISDKLCNHPALQKVCSDVLFIITGFDPNNLNTTRLPVYLHHTPSSTSVKNIVHFTQLIKSGKFANYDYGYFGNLERYHKFSPPEYDLGKIETAIAIFSGPNDWLADPTDIRTYLIPKLNNLIFNKSIPKWTHMDFTWGEDADKKCYNDIMKIMESKI